MIEELPVLEDDGLITPSVGPWAEQKYRLVWNYAQMFATAMKTKWDARVYMDLFAGSGRSRIKGTEKIVPASPLLALDIRNRFNKYFFCEGDIKKMKALKIRVGRDHADADVEYIEGNVNENIDNILFKMPQHKKGFRVISFCFVDPYGIKNLNLATIKKLSARFIDFLILIPSDMDAHRNVARYEMKSNSAIENFTGVKEWRDLWGKERMKGTKFGLFVIELLASEMKELGYMFHSRGDTVHIRSHEKNLPLYHLAFFSRHPLGKHFWDGAKKYSDPQLKIF
jgi:three-Cys-motif partner protein